MYGDIAVNLGRVILADSPQYSQMVTVAFGRRHSHIIMGVKIVTPDGADSAVEVCDVVVWLDLHQHVFQDHTGLAKGPFTLPRHLQNVLVSLVLRIIELLQLLLSYDFSGLFNCVGFQYNAGFQQLLYIVEAQLVLNTFKGYNVFRNIRHININAAAPLDSQVIVGRQNLQRFPHTAAAYTQALFLLTFRWKLVADGQVLLAY